MMNRSKPITLRVEGKAALRTALKAYPRLTPFGLGGEKAKWKHAEIESAAAFLRLVHPAKTKDRKTFISSYALKHIAERWARTATYAPYIQVGSFVVAAIALGFPVREPDWRSPNFGVAIRMRELRPLAEQFGWYLG